MGGYLHQVYLTRERQTLGASSLSPNMAWRRHKPCTHRFILLVSIDLQVTHSRVRVLRAHARCCSIHTTPFVFPRTGTLLGVHIRAGVANTSGTATDYPGSALEAIPHPTRLSGSRVPSVPSGDVPGFRSAFLVRRFLLSPSILPPPPPSPLPNLVAVHGSLRVKGWFMKNFVCFREMPQCWFACLKG